MITNEGYLDVEGGRIWYAIYGEQQGKIPLLTLHGGPGSSHLGMQPLAESLAAERPVIVYDQLGCGRSDRPTDVSLFTMERYVRELATIREALGLMQVHILGHSWGTMLLTDYLLTKPDGVVSAIFSSPCLSASRWVDDANHYRLDLPKEVQAVLLDCEANGTTDSQAYREAEKEYVKRHVCRVERTEEQKAKQKQAFGNQVYNYMWGPSEFCATGTLQNYDRTDRLGEIMVPSLFTCGFYDEASPASTDYYHALVPNAEFHVFANSSHSAILEEHDEYLDTVSTFIAKHE